MYCIINYIGKLFWWFTLRVVKTGCVIKKGKFQLGDSPIFCSGIPVGMRGMQTEQTQPTSLINHRITEQCAVKCRSSHRHLCQSILTLSPGQ